MTGSNCLLMSLAVLTGVAPSARAQDTPDPIRTQVTARLRDREGDLIAFRRDIHQHPELSGQEVRTSAAVARRLRELGLEVRTEVGGHGVVATLRGGRPGAVVAFRADMDAMPSLAPDPVEFPSLTPGVRHICGHDIHTTIGVAIAEGLAAVRQDLPGTVMLIFQPAEERATGARAMLQDSVFGGLRPVAIYSLHTAPLPVGTIGTRPGVLLAGRDGIRVTLSGGGDLGAAADSVRRVLAAPSTITMAQAFTSSEEDFVLVQAGPAQQTADGKRVIEAVIARATESTGARVRDAILAGLARVTLPDVSVERQYGRRIVPGVTNDSSLAAAADEAIRAELGREAVVSIAGVVPAFSEDFGYFQDSAPGVMYFLGVANAARGWAGMPHSPNYVADEAAILVGARAIASVLLERLRPAR